MKLARCTCAAIFSLLFVALGKIQSRTRAYFKIQAILNAGLLRGLLLNQQAEAVAADALSTDGAGGSQAGRVSGPACNHFKR